MTRTMFAVSVVDGSGNEVYGEPVTARFELAGGGRRDVTRTVGHDGRAHFAEELVGELLGVTLLAAGERVGPLLPAAGTGLVIEA
ncbi:MAG TPA: hypothetical protein VFZ85_19090 [Jiangellaceae bacterium]